MKTIFSILLVLCVFHQLSYYPLNASTNDNDRALLNDLQDMAMSNNYSDAMVGKVELAIIGDEKAVSELPEMFFSESYGAALMDRCEAGGKDHLWKTYGKLYAYKSKLSILAGRLADSNDERIISVLERYYYGDDQPLDSGRITETAVSRIMHKMLPLPPDITEIPPIVVTLLDVDNEKETGSVEIRYVGSRVVIELLLKRIGDRRLWIPSEYIFKRLGGTEAPPGAENKIENSHSPGAEEQDQSR